MDPAQHLVSQFISIRAQFTCHLTGCMGQISNRLSSRKKMAALLCGVLPVLLVTPVFILSERSHCQSNTTEPDRCLLMETGALFMTSQHPQPIRACRLVQAYCSSALLCTFLLTLAGIMGLMVRSRALLWRVLSCGGFVGCQQRALLQEMDLRMVLYPLVFFCCWGPATLVALLRMLFPLGPQGLTGAALYITQVLACGSQGLWFSLVFGGSRSRVLRDAQTQMPLMRNQKHRGYLSLGPAGYS
ncbi:transmembrane protein 116 [Periophthalmus magnuspinnatus]|uniref:transmembrane protein 116 n=1 Tax=Periophthalmus magnuspinnatus TaxID=409849 RepID=UPI0024363033|nr:transmembrane protein 116 [Periophthalmus magnuspinnatus]